MSRLSQETCTGVKCGFASCVKAEYRNAKYRIKKYKIQKNMKYMCHDSARKLFQA